MKFVFEGKEFDDDSLSNECKINVSKIQNILVRKNQLTLEYNDLQVLETHYISLLKKELPKEKKKEKKKSKA